MCLMHDGWDYVHELSLSSLPNLDATLSYRYSFVQPVSAENDVTVNLAAESVRQLVVLPVVPVTGALVRGLT